MPRRRPARGRTLVAALAAVALIASIAGCSALVPNWWIGGWQLTTYDGKPAAAGATMTFSASDVVIHTGCNDGAGAYTYAEPTLTLTGVAFTARPCTDSGAAEQDAALRALAKGPVTMHASQSEMTIDPGAGGAVLVFVRTSGA